MKNWLIITSIVLLQHFVQTKQTLVVCFFDSSNPTGISAENLENALDHCSHFIYGYATLMPQFYTLAFDGSVARTLKLTDVADLKKKFPHVKFLLSLGGDRDASDPLKYLHLLETSAEKQDALIRSALRLLRLYEFDGLDLAYQFPRHDAQIVQHKFLEFWSSVRNLLKRGFAANVPRAREYMKLFTKFIRNIHSTFATENLMLTLSVLPNVNSSMYFDIPSIGELFDLIHLWSFDFHNPTRNPKEADYPAPLIPPPSSGNHRMPSNNVNSQLQHWRSYNVVTPKIILAIPSFGRTWQMSARSQGNGLPMVEHTYGPSEAGEETQMPGVLSWSEICERLRNRSLIVQGSYDYGQYFVYPGNEDFPHDTWVGYDGPNIAHYKTLYAQDKHLGGVALVDLSFDDFRGSCSGLRFPILKYMNGIVT